MVPRCLFMPAALAAIALATPGLVRGKPVTEPSLKGYGIKGVDGATLAEMHERCARAARGDAEPAGDESQALLRARCDQLARSTHNQPGNARSGTR